VELTHTFQLLTIVFVGILPLLWNLVIRQKIDNWNDRAGIIEYYKGLHESLGYLSYYHKIVSGVLVSIGLFFGIIAVLVS